MKKVFSMMLVAISIVLASSYPVSVNAAPKDDIKAAKQQAKDLKKQGWIVEGATTLENGLVKIAEQENAGYKPLIGTSLGSQKPNVAKTKARNNAINEFAEYGKSIVKARINTKVDDVDEEEVDNIVSGYERMAIREINEIIPVPSLVLRRETKDGKYDYMCYYLIDSKSLLKAQKKALEDAIENSGLAAKYGDSISDFVNSGFNEK